MIRNLLLQVEFLHDFPGVIDGEAVQFVQFLLDAGARTDLADEDGILLVGLGCCVDGVWVPIAGRPELRMVISALPDAPQI